MKKTIILSLFLLLLINLTGCKSETKQTRKEKTDNDTLEGIMNRCDKRQRRVNMIIIPSCYLRGMLADLQYTKEEALKRCLDNWDDCERGMETAWGSLGYDHSTRCKQQVFVNKEDNEIAEYIKPCILDKLIAENQLSKSEAVEYCKKEVTEGYGTCEEKIKELENYRKTYLK